MDKNVFTYLAQAIDQYRADRAASAEEISPQKPSRLRRFLRWLTPNGGTLLLVVVLILTQNVWAKRATAPSAPGPSATTVNYQGRLADHGGTPLDGTYGMSFALYDAATDGTLIWGPESHTAVPVSNGLFSVGLGSQTSGGIPTTVWDGDRYLEITVGGETLSPRELIRSVPIAGMALTVPDESITSMKMSPTFFQVLLDSDTKLTADDPDKQTILEMNLSPGQRTTYLIFASITSRHTLENHRVMCQVDVETTGEVLPINLTNSHPTSGRNGTQSTSGVGTITLGPGEHTLRLSCFKEAGVTQSAYLRKKTQLLAMPFSPSQ